MQPSIGTGLVECFDDTDRNGVMKITDKDKQKFVIIQSDGVHRNIQRFDLSALELEEVEGA